MTEFSIRLFSCDPEIEHIGEGLVARTLPRAEWTHEAHLAACTWIMTACPTLVAERDLPGIISAYNESVGGVNSDTEGYHETITQTFILGIRRHLATRPVDESLTACVNALLAGPYGRRDWPLTLYSKARLFSVEARRRYLPPDLA